MTEKIGQVVLDDTYYPGEDLYSDGEIEDELLEIARSYPEEQWNQVIAEKKSWPVLYHYSHVRENILSWLPFTGNESVLEIGSGCGAVTGALLKNAGRVTCIELSRKRSLINAYRHQNFSNLKILMGNFQEIEPTLPEKYDYITLIGVFEYGESYIQSENPYVDFLRIIARHLKPDGKIVMAIENRFGLKYWAGCTEDHFGTLFEGLEGYRKTNGVKTFTRKELLSILDRAGGLKASWYYPFPDYKLPSVIFSDRRLPEKGELHCSDRNYDRLRLQLFPESPVYDSLIENDLFPEFSNSYLLIIGNTNENPETEYVKFSNERDSKFALRTEIVSPADMKKNVRKVPASKEAEKHVRNIETVSHILSAAYEKENLEVNACLSEKEGVALEYLEGITLEEWLDRCLENGKYHEIEQILLDYADKVRRIHSKELFKKTDEFIRVFGDVELEGTVRCAAVSNIDLIPANILIEKNRVTVLDYEWTFSFPVPGMFMVYRLLHYYLESDDKRQKLKEWNLYEKAGLTPEEMEICRIMEANFQKYMLGKHTPLGAMYPDISPGKADARIFYEQKLAENNNKRLKVYYDYGTGFCEEYTSVYPLDENGAAAQIIIPDKAEKLRLDPGEAVCVIRIKSFRYEDGSKVEFQTNGETLSENRYYFEEGDPQFILNNLARNKKSVGFEISFLDIREGRKGVRENYELKIAELQAENALLTDKIHQMEGTKVWKMYRSIKKQKS